MLKSLVYRIMLLCCITMTLLLGFFISANQYAIYVMRRQVIEAQESLLTFYTAQLDDSLTAIRLDMIQYINDSLNLHTLSLYPPSENSYKLNALSCKQWLEENIITNKIADTLFIYASNSNTLLAASKSLGGIRYRFIDQNIDEILTFTDDVSTANWVFWKTEGYISEENTPAWVIIKTVQVSKSVILGAIVLIQDFISPLQHIGNYERLLTLIYRDDGTLLAPYDLPDGFSDIIAQNIISNEDSFVAYNEEDQENYVGIISNMQTVPICFLTLLPESEILKQLPIFRTLVSYIYAILFVVILIASLLIHQSLYRPFQQIISAMNKVSHGDLTVRLPQGRTTEFILVNTQFNNMVKRIDELNQDVEKQASRAHRAEIRHLQAQINPHFYQNTLNLIYNLAALKKYQLIQETTLYLADYFRFIMRSGDQPIELRDELKHITNYMELQKIRYPGKVEYSVQVEDPLLLQPILPLLIQPFVENSMIHGYTTAHNLFRVDVRVFSNTKGYTVIEVEDNGKGMEPEMIKRLNDIMEESNTIPEHHIGIWNVVSRLYSYYGPSAQIKFLSKKETGTIVRIEFLVPLGEGVNGNEYLNSR